MGQNNEHRIVFQQLLLQHLTGRSPLKTPPLLLWWLLADEGRQS